MSSDGHSMQRRLVPVQRNCPARLVPTGTPIQIPAGTFVTLTQALGSAFTVVVNGNMARVDGRDADALGLKIAQKTYQANADGSVNMTDVQDALRNVYDPEIPVNVVDLGLIYGCQLQQQNGKNLINVRMTLTAPGCGMGPVLVEDIKQHLLQVPNVHEVAVELVFDPPWHRDMMTEEAQLELGIF